MSVAHAENGMPGARREPPAMRIATGATVVIVATLPFSHSVAVRTTALVVALAALAFSWRSLAVPRIPLLWFFALLAVLGGASLLWSVDPAYSRAQLKPELLYPFLIFVVTYAVTRDLRVLASLGLAAAAATAISVVGPVGAWSDHIWADRWLLYSGLGFYSTWLVIVYPFALAACVTRTLPRRWRRIALALSLLALVAGIISFNRAFPIIVAIETMIVIGWHVLRGQSPRKYRSISIAAVLVVALGGSLVAIQKERHDLKRSAESDVVESVQRDARWALWKDLLQTITASPWRGAGFGRGILRHDLPVRHDNTFLWHGHNLVLNYGLQMGVPGMVLILALFGAALWHLARAYRRCDDTLRPYIVAAIVMVIGVFLKNQTDDFFIRQGALAFWAALGAALGVAARIPRHAASTAARA